MGTGRQAYHSQGKRDEKKRKGERERKKRFGFIMFVNEIAAAGCGIPNDSLARILFVICLVETSHLRKKFLVASKY